MNEEPGVVVPVVKVQLNLVQPVVVTVLTVLQVVFEAPVSDRPTLIVVNEPLASLA
jgi:hypothetical protein